MTEREATERLQRIRQFYLDTIKDDTAVEAVDMAIKAVKKQEKDRWISVTERLPENYSDVLVWFEYFRYGRYNRLYQTHGIGNYSAKYDAWTINHESGWNKLRVIAWCPLPEPYTEEEL